jgi:hypothetical protein
MSFNPFLLFGLLNLKENKFRLRRSLFNQQPHTGTGGVPRPYAMGSTFTLGKRQASLRSRSNRRKAARR